MATFSIASKYTPMLNLQTNKSKFINQLLEEEYKRQEQAYGVGNFKDCTKKEGELMPSQPDISSFVMEKIREEAGNSVTVSTMYQLVREKFLPDSDDPDIQLQREELKNKCSEGYNENILDKNIRFALLGLKQLGLIASEKRGEYFWKG